MLRKRCLLSISAALAAPLAVPASAATITGLTLSGNTLSTVSINQEGAGAVVYNAADLINGTVTSYADNTSPGVLTSSTETPPAGTRAATLSDLAINTGFLNVQSNGHLTFTFDSSIANIPGIDLLIFDWGAFGGNTPDQFAVTINGVTHTGLTNLDSSVPAGGDWYPQGEKVSAYTHYSESGVSSLAQFENVSLGASSPSSSTFVGLIGLDFDAFDVASGGTITSLTISGGNSGVDPTLILGIVPEPASFALVSLGAVLMFRRPRG